MRLVGIDCPERKQAFGTRAKEALLVQVGGRPVSVQWQKRDRDGRVVGKVVDGQRDVNLAPVREGLWWWYRKYAGEQSAGDQVFYGAKV